MVGNTKQMMSQMSPKQRRQIIKENIIYKTTVEIAEMCQVTKRTILRDIKQWREEGGFEEFLMDEFFHLYPTIKKDYPDKAFDRLCYLLGRTITQKREITEQVEVSEHVKVDMNVLTDEDKSILDRAARLLEQKGARRLSDLH